MFIISTFDDIYDSQKRKQKILKYKDSYLHFNSFVCTYDVCNIYFYEASYTDTATVTTSTHHPKLKK